MSPNELTIITAPGTQHAASWYNGRPIVITEKFSQAISSSTEMRKSHHYLTTSGGDPTGNSMILFAVSTLSYTDTRTIGWPFLITIPAVSAASAVAYDRFVCLSTGVTIGRALGSLALRKHFLTHLWTGSSASRNLITRVVIR